MHVINNDNYNYNKDNLGTIPRGLQKNLRTFGITIKVELIQNVALPGTA